jgi:hypothetical protein
MFHLVAFVAAIAIVALLIVLSLFSGAPMPIDLIATAQSATIETTAAEEEVRLPPFLADEITVVGNGGIEGAPGVTSFASAVAVSVWIPRPL